MLFTRYVLVGRLEDGAQVFWDTREKTPVKRPAKVAAKPGGTWSPLAVAVAVPWMLALARWLDGVLSHWLPKGSLESGSADGGDTLLGFLRPVGMDVWEWSMYVDLAVMWGTALLWYWCAVRLVFGRAADYMPVSPRELAFAAGRRASSLRYIFGGHVIGTLFLLCVWGIPIMVTVMFWLDGTWMRHPRYDWVYLLGLVWMLASACSPLILWIRWRGPWDWRGRLARNRHAGNLGGV